MLRSPTTLLLCTEARFLVFIQRTWNLRIFPRLPGPLGAQGWVQSRSCIKSKDPVLRSPTALLLCSWAEFQLFIQQTCDPRGFPGLYKGPGGPGLRLGKKLHITKTSYFEVPFCTPTLRFPFWTLVIFSEIESHQIFRFKNITDQ